MKAEHIFITIIEDEIIPYGNLKTLVETIGSDSKYSTINRAIKAYGKAEVDGVEIRKLFVIRGSRNMKNG